jgi:hypothetical protein
MDGPGRRLNHLVNGPEYADRRGYHADGIVGVRVKLLHHIVGHVAAVVVVAAEGLYGRVGHGLDFRLFRVVSALLRSASRTSPIKAARQPIRPMSRCLDVSPRRLIAAPDSLRCLLRKTHVQPVILERASV